jgi:hypothetical protein
MVRAAGLPLTINAVMHRQNLERLGAIIELAVELGAKRLEVAHTQYYGWALPNRVALMPTREQSEGSIALVEAARARLKGILVIDYVVPDYYARYPKPCMGGWGRQNLNVTPSGKVLPCHAAESITSLRFDNVKERPLAEIYGMRAAAIAVYPMYRGVARLVGMEGISFEGDRPKHEIDALEKHWADYDFFFIHIKKTDSYGEDGNFDAKVKEIEAVDAEIPRILALDPGAIIVTGDHSTPAKLRSHSAHPVPTLLWSKNAMPDRARTFGERACSEGYFGVFHATNLIPQAMFHAGRLKRFGA